MPSLLFRRDNDKNTDLNVNPDENNTDGNLANHTRNLIITLVVLVVFGIMLAASLYAIRRQRRRQKESGNLPSYDAATRNRSRLTISTNHRGSSSYVYSEKQNLINNSSPMSYSPDNVPEIRITFPEEEDEDGRRVSGRVVVVKVGEAGVGFVRPLEQEGLPPYQQQQPNERFDSVDIERIGGLKELK